MTEDEKKKAKAQEYDASQITVLEGLDPVRKRPGMYIGGTGTDGLHHLVWEILDNAIDEAMAGFCNKIAITLHNDGSVSVFDNGRGIPVDKVKSTGKSALETVLTVLHAGGKFGDGGYKVSGGLHGVGASVVNALSLWVKAEVHKNGKKYFIEFNRGVAKDEIKVIGDATDNGTTITFLPDSEIFTTTTLFSFQNIVNRCRQQAYLTKGVMISIVDERDAVKKVEAPKPEEDEESGEVRTGRAGGDEDEGIIETQGGPQQYAFYFEGGISSYVLHLNKNREAINWPPMYIEKEQNGVMVELSLAYTNDYREHLYSFANNINTPEGGTHLTGFKTALTRAMNDYAKKNNLTKDPLTGEDVREGITAVLSVKLTDPQFEGQTKAKLGNTEVRTIVDSVTAESLSIYLDEHPTEARKIIEKCSLSARARLAARAARDTIIRKGALEGMTLPGKLADCSSRDPKRTEIYIVEGDSAGGCFSGDTKIALSDGRDVDFVQLMTEWSQGKENYCYTIRENGEIGIEKILNPRRTKKMASVIKVVLDNDEIITCTPDHLFMIRDGSYIKAKDLKRGLSLMPLRRKKSIVQNRITIAGYEMVLNPSTHKWNFVHVLADQYNLRNNIYAEEIGYHKHHLDFNKLNNNPNNIKRLSKEDHLDIHRKHVKLTLHRPDVIEKCKLIKKSPEYRKNISEKMLQMREELSKRAKKQWENPKYKKFMLDRFLKFYNENDAYKKANNELLNKNQKEYWASSDNRKKQSNKVKSFFASCPGVKKQLSKIAKVQWENKELLEWRKQITKEQWTEEFRLSRKAAYDKVYLKESMSFARKIYDMDGNIDFYEDKRSNQDRRNPNILKQSTLMKRFFNGNRDELVDAVKNFNHKIKRIERIDEKMDVYDIEVPHSHNFALSAGVFVHNSAKQGRDRNFQAILPLRGKILNVERARLDRMLSSDEIKALIIAMGVGIGEEVNYAKLRYDRVIIMTDADVDGAHIRTLLLTFFFRHFPELISHGHIYIAQPPLFSVTKGKEKHWVYTEAERDAVVKQMMSGKTPVAEVEAATGEEVVPGEEVVQEKTGGVKPTIQRFKGLGEMSAEQLWDTTMNPEKRVLLQVTIDSAEKADEIFTMLMGDQVPPRKKFIQTRAKTVQNLDT